MSSYQSFNDDPEPDLLAETQAQLQPHMPPGLQVERIQRGESSRLFLLISSERGDSEGGAREALATVRRLLVALQLPADVPIEVRAVPEE